jgi:hypothetical protein
MKPRLVYKSDLLFKLLSRPLKQILLFLIFLLIAPGCEPVQHTIKVVNGEPFDLKIGEKVFINNHLVFTVDSVHDGRCPVNMFCFWAGDASLFFTIKENYSRIDTMICLASCKTNPFYIAGYKWNVQDIKPYPDTRIKYDPGGITIRMTVTGI